MCSRIDVEKTFHELCAICKERVLRSGETISTKAMGHIELRRVHRSWIEQLMLGAVDYHGEASFPVLQIVPKSELLLSVDIPDASNAFDSISEPPWKWLQIEWPYDVPERQMVLTDVGFLGGESVTYIGRHRGQPDETSLDAWTVTDEDIPESVIRPCPLGVLLSMDSTIEEAIMLSPGQYAVRDSAGDPWRINEED